MSVRALTHFVLTVIFLCVIFLPPFTTLEGCEPVQTLTEKRAPVPPPTLTFDIDSLQAFPRRFDEYWNDAFGFRAMLVRSYNTLALWMGVSPSTKVVIGKAGWLFVGDYYRAVEHYRATNPFTRRQLKRWRRVLEARQAWLAERGIHYVFIIAPDKGTIYPEYMPAALNRVGPATRLEQLVAYLHERSNIRVVDVRDALRDAKVHDRVYEPLDSHWNDLGAWVVYAEILERLGVWFPQMQPLPLDNFDLSHVTDQGNDLAMLLSLSDLIPGARLTLVPRVPRRARWLRPDGLLPPGSAAEASTCRVTRAADRCLLVSEIDDPSLPRAVMFHDSFGEFLRPFLSEHFARVFYSWQNLFDPVIIEREKPTVVLHEMVERVLMEDLPVDPEEVTAARRRPSGN